MSLRVTGSRTGSADILPLKQGIKTALVDTLFRDVRAHVLDCLMRRHVIDDALDHMMGEGGGGGIQASKNEFVVR